MPFPDTALLRADTVPLKDVPEAALTKVTVTLWAEPLWLWAGVEVGAGCEAPVFVEALDDDPDDWDEAVGVDDDVDDDEDVDAADPHPTRSTDARSMPATLSAVRDLNINKPPRPSFPCTSINVLRNNRKARGSLYR